MKILVTFDLKFVIVAFPSRAYLLISAFWSTYLA